MVVPISFSTIGHVPPPPPLGSSVPRENRRTRGLMRVTTSKSHSSTCGWSPRAYRQLVANQFPYIQPISINWPLISSKGDARGRFSLASERARAVSRACNTRSRARERREGIRFVLSRASWHSIHRVGKTQPRYPFVSRGLIHGIDVISDYLNDG